MILRYFSESEFLSARPSCKLSQMDEGFMRLLDDARHVAQTPFIINSAFRSVEYEKFKGRKGTSSHCKGVAVDLHCISSEERIRIVSALVKVGFRRIGIAKTFIHVDYDNSKSPSLWIY